MRGPERIHPGAETLSAFVQGTLGKMEMRTVGDHLDGCDECTSDVALAM